MRKVFIGVFAVILIFAALLSCKKIVAAIFGGTDVNIPEVHITIPPVIAISSNEMSLGSFSQNINLDSTVRANTGGTFGVNAVNSIKVKQVLITITNPDPSNNLSNFQSARVTLQSNTNSTPTDFFSITFPDTYTATYTFTPTDSPELLPYLKGNTITYNIYGRVRRTTNKPLTMVVTVTLRAN